MNIISASRRTDIPAFHSQWFFERVKEGYCEVTNPFNKRKSVISLLKKDVTGFVFWSKNYIPFVNILKILKEMNYNFYLNYTVNNYSKKLENLKNNNEDIANNLIYLSEHYPIFWRYDPIYISKNMNLDFHLKNFEFLASIFSNRVERIIINFIQEYKKVLRRVDNTNTSLSDKYISIQDNDKIDFVLEIKKIADKHKIPVYSCNEMLLNNNITKRNHCIDKAMFEQMTGNTLDIKESPAYKGCHCYKCIDIGTYDTCQNNCIYCYANS